MTDTKPVSERLEDAAAYIDKHGWTQGALRLDTGEVCARGAIAVSDLGAARALTAFIGDTIPNWNDQPWQTKERVTGTIRACAKHHRILEERAASDV